MIGETRWSFQPFLSNELQTTLFIFSTCKKLTKKPVKQPNWIYRAHCTNKTDFYIGNSLTSIPKAKQVEYVKYKRPPLDPFDQEFYITLWCIDTYSITCSLTGCLSILFCLFNHCIWFTTSQKVNKAIFMLHFCFIVTMG